LRAESSTAFGLGVEVEPWDGFVAKVNGFHNEVRDLIDTQPIAVKTNGQQVFSYFNLERIYTRGLEAELSGAVLRSATLGTLTLGIGYQYLDTADRDVLDDIDAGLLFRRDEDGRDVRVTREDYEGLAGRSRHSGTLRLAHTHARLGLTTSARAVWRSRYVFGDVITGQAVYDEAAYAPGYALLHVTTTKTLGPAEIQLGVRNLLNHTDPERLPYDPGRVLFVGAGYRF
jgi:outer membrane receptor for ferrienterochelin and colicins